MKIACVCAYALDPEREKRLATLCMLQKLRLRSIAPGAYCQTLAAAAGLEAPSEKAYTGQRLEQPMLVLAGLSEEQLNRLLRGLRGLPPIPLKAVLTQTNRSWDALRLYEELQAERAAIAAARARAKP